MSHLIILKTFFFFNFGRFVFRYRFVVVHPTVDSWLKYAHFEEKQSDRNKARAVYEKAVALLEDAANDERLFVSFAKFEEKCKEVRTSRETFN
jgi:crooked neck